MSIVLAIEPDRGQAAHLHAIVRHQVGAELVLAHTTEGALDAIGNRVPDLVLVPALLSPQDDAALAAALRVIAAAAHVRTLTIPVLATGRTREPAGGMLAKWRRGRAASPEPDGCDPSVFGEQISAYLQEAAAERAQIEEDALQLKEDALPEVEPVRLIALPAVVDAVPVAAIRELQYDAPTPASETVPPWATEPAPEPEPVQAWAAAPIDEPLADLEETAAAVDQQAAALQEAVFELPTSSTDEESPIDGEEPAVDLSDELDGLSEGTDEDLFDGERVGVYSISVEADEPAADTFDLRPSNLEPETAAELVVEQVATPAGAAMAVVSHAAEVGPETPSVDAMLAEPVLEEPALAEPLFAETMFVEAPDAPRSDIEPWVPMYLTPGRLWPALEGMPAETPTVRAEQPDWIGLVASLRQDIERRRSDQAAAADPIAARPSDGANADAPRPVKRQKAQAKKAKPVQDEWGFFDPEQCGFSTLLAKLDEITQDARR